MSTLIRKRRSIPPQGATPSEEHRRAEEPDRVLTTAPAGVPRTAADASAGAPAPDRAAVVRDAVVAGGAVLAGVLITIGFALDPARTESESAELVAAVADAPGRFYAANLLGALGLVMLTCVALAVIRLVPGRGRGLATGGGLLLMLGSIAAAAGVFMYGAVVSVLVESESTATAVRLQEVLGDSARTGLTFLIGFPAFLLGMVLCAAALLRARTVPWAVPALIVLGLVGVVALGEASPILATAADVLLAAACAAIGVLFWQRRATRLPARTIVLPD